MVPVFKNVGKRSTAKSYHPKSYHTILSVVSDEIARAFNRSGTTRAVAVDISTAFDRVSHVGLLHKLSLTEF